ncbi:MULTISPECIES: sugar phosphate nucleotidyltransferase [unclassified Arcicella]|uniref:sugar phosphate nucleotidyltransferase n=1 Tax=unclassified Arcicella TaxID=2644986 RepID=UPI0028661C4D|nr:MULTISPECIES: sugar phosphate nucleotidyltransferase [unclassified Arcicella]MDR6561819.1 glucose-1-phosphate thymidylyltransferase/glucose-1-phosphate adenylyltransferase [Arcicella sp. BE51]MDR6813965.1 glucose-1-phosphate thymidylyltransferase/glucose-1-phosphate adenylyltransferase [Arcicella sp. BE140]MDR6825328.1 glucose-1-phosphate thymidylyltransferase/glucose-1-phosphate adenylyltransferase [Arcicella sp. BE139]
MAKLLIMAGGMSSRMKKAEGTETLDSTLIEQANTLPKGMIGVGKDGRPFMDYLIYNAHRAGYTEVLILKNPKDNVTKPYYDQLVADNKAWGITFKYATQQIAPDREKPAGTADAIQQALEQTPEWKGERFTVCNSDNLYSVKVLTLLKDCPVPNAVVSYESIALGVAPERVKAFAVIKADEEDYLIEIIEKPNDEQIESARDKNGKIGVNMNVFHFYYDDILEYVSKEPFNPVRNERELPSAVMKMAKENAKKVITVPVEENVPDLTSKGDISIVQKYLVDEFGEF